MENYDPLETVDQLRAWADKSLSSLKADTVRMAAAKRRYRTVMKVVDQLERLQIPISEDIISEKEALEELISTSNEMGRLTSLAKELSSLAKDINRQLRGERGSRKNKGRRGPAKQLRVSFPDGTAIYESKATDTFVRSIQHIGLKRVAELPTNRAYGHPLVSAIRNESSRSYRELDGYFVETNISTTVKAKYIQRIADALQIDVSIEIID